MEAVGWSPALAPSRIRHLAWAVALGAAAASLLLTAKTTGQAGFDTRTSLEFLVGCSFVVSGFIVWERRENRLGPLMVVVGLTWFARPLVNVDSSVVFTGAIWLTDTWFILFALFLLSLPFGRLGARLDVLTLGALFVVALPLELAWLLFFETGEPGNAILVWPSADAADAIDSAQRILVLTGSLLLVVTLWKRWLEASAPLRRLLVPALIGGAAVFVSASQTAASKFTSPPEWVAWVVLVAFIAVPVAVLVGVVRTRLARSAVSELVVALSGNPSPAELRAALASSVGDPSLQLAFWLPEYQAYSDVNGQPYTVPSDDPRRHVTPVDRDGRHVALLVHDASLLDDSGLLDAVGAAAGMALENARLQAELRARLVELQGSRARLLEATDSERKRLERNLHDGAQQRLVAISLELGRMEARADADPEMKALVQRTKREAEASLNELRELARGIHPALVTDHGLTVALEALIARAPIPVTLEIELDRRLPQPIEVAAYYVVSECVTNVAKYACASETNVGVRRDRGRVVVEIKDDGVGGANTEGGSGLRGLADRVEALGGRVRVWSPAGGGTRVRAEIPCA